MSAPLTLVPCDGSYALFVGAAVIPANYRTEVVRAYLDRYPGSSYLLAEQNCSSLRHHMDNGASIYTVYYGPYSTLAQACEALPGRRRQLHTSTRQQHTRGPGTPMLTAGLP